MNAAEVARRAALADHCSDGRVALGALASLVRRYAAAHRLSERETAVLSCGARGLHRKATASYLGCSAGTVDTYGGEF